MVDEFTYPEHVQQALDLVEQATAEEQRREQQRRSNRYHREADRWERRADREQRTRAAAIESKDVERRRKQIEAQQAKQLRRTTPPAA